MGLQFEYWKYHANIAADPTGLPELDGDPIGAVSGVRPRKNVLFSGQLLLYGYRVQIFASAEGKNQ